MGNKVMATALPEVKLIEPEVFCDEFGFCFESFSADEFADDVSPDFNFVQDRHLRAVRGVLRGLHYQVQRPQGRLVRVVVGEVFDVVVDVRLNSPNFGKWSGTCLSAANQRQVWVPPGFAHGFVVLSDTAECLWKTTEYWFPELERCILWRDPDIGIEWPIEIEPTLGAKDAAGRRLYEAENFA
ncbi:dTDP-4-dehydrorhamnose 3,5-epimerase [Paraburkholderia domus]|uniref:dTDP-4-dehydrorhamnose 3,5-epimerase n=1 Tax=Paraburkholderia domus TaxID=2793075 RepID=UPI0019116EDC|nr:dTDP-4-dehydrorhamnose 3,5-epimerase [Paraburkholderia domus]MBK5050043.1 dTDP-4-dehydrorhamnose 3,5-epimerase [Burkholderia sp. R-70006]CAE6751447.1 dTDP-4-dehydrorhamnose 3,5-epimerase [Paraburkholderia domus]